MEQLDGELIRILFQKEAYTVAVFKSDDTRITAVGPLLCPETGLVYSLDGEWVEHPKFGRQFRFSSYRMLPPATPKAMEKFLASGIIKGIGRKTAKKLVDVFGVDVLSVIRDAPSRIYGITGIAKTKAATIIQSYQDFAYGENLMTVLNTYGLDGDVVYRVFRRYGKDSLSMIEENPYILCLDLREISFEKSDQIAYRLGFRGDEDKRIRSALVCSLLNAREEGHVFFPTDLVLTNAMEMLSRSTYFLKAPDVNAVSIQLIKAAKEGVIRVFRNWCYLPELFTAEQIVAELLSQIVNNSRPWQVDTEAVIKTMENDFGIKYAVEQKEAFFAVANSGLTVITGGPGTGKTTIVRGLIALINRARPNAQIILCAPTGRAAKRLAETTDQPASTLHKVLKLRGNETDYLMNEIEPLDADVVIVDEVSMVDIVMMANLLQALKKGTKFVLVGDQDQLPSVGPGQVLHDIIKQQIGAIIHLNHVFRQADMSDIVTSAHRINRGEVPDLLGRKEFIFLNRQSPAEILNALLLTVTRAAERAGYSLEDIQILSPMRFTQVGVWNLNKVLQNHLNPLTIGKREVKYGSHIFRTGDKVMQLKNNYEKEVFNGDIGFIVDILLSGEEEVDEDTIVVSLDNERVAYNRSEWEQLTLAYASTVHKAQGSEYPVMIMPITRQHHRMLRRNLIYTAVTRAREKVILIGEPEALAYAVKNNHDCFRYSGLAQRWRDQEKGVDDN